LVFFVFILLLTNNVINLYCNTYITSYSDLLNKQTHIFLENRVDSTNIHTALELILKHQSDYVSKDFIPEVKAKNPIWYKFLLLNILLTFVSIIRSITVIGIGKYQKKLTLYKAYIRVVTIILPTSMVIVPFLHKLIVWLY